MSYIFKQNGGQCGGAHDLEEKFSALSTSDSVSVFTNFLIYIPYVFPLSCAQYKGYVLNHAVSNQLTNKGIITSRLNIFPFSLITFFLIFKIWKIFIFLSRD